MTLEIKSKDLNEAFQCVRGNENYDTDIENKIVFDLYEKKKALDHSLLSNSLLSPSLISKKLIALGSVLNG